MVVFKKPCSDFSDFFFFFQTFTSKILVWKECLFFPHNPSEIYVWNMFRLEDIADIAYTNCSRQNERYDSFNLRGTAPPTEILTCFACYLKIINTFFEK